MEAIIIGDGGGPLLMVEHAQVVAGRGIRGDRNFLPQVLPNGKPISDITLIEAEALEALERETGLSLPPVEARRNVLTRGIALNDLVGRRFLLGKIECFGTSLCEPCRHLEQLTRPGVLRGLVHRGGLCADILSDGELFRGDSISVGAGALGPAQHC